LKEDIATGGEVHPMNLTDELWEAAEDLRLLLNRGYPRDASLQLVGNRYNLDRDCRHLLRRGVFPESVAEGRMNKLVSVQGLRGKDLAIDGYNCVITLESALKGKAILLADDAFIRDISGVSGGYRQSQKTGEALGLIMDLLKETGPGEVLFLFDSPISGSGELAARVRGLIRERGIQGDASAVKVPERIMASYQGICASSDAAVIDQAAQVFDLAGYLIQEQLGTPYIDLRKKS
jgi:hypothetical protein